MNKKKVRREPFLNWLVVAFAAMFLLISAILIKQAVESNEEYYKYKDVAVSVDAEITDVDVYTDADDDNNYRVYITYDYDDKTYRNIYLGQFSTKKSVGEDVTVKILPDDPSYIFGDDIGAEDLSGATYMFCIVISILLYKVFFKKTEENQDRVINDVSVYNLTKSSFELFCCVISIFVARVALLNLYPDFITAESSATSTLVIILAAVILLAYELIKGATYSFDKYTVVREKCTYKKDNSDSDRTSHMTVFESGRKTKLSECYHCSVLNEYSWLILNKKGKILGAYNENMWKNAFYAKDSQLYRKIIFKDIFKCLVLSVAVAVMFLAYFSIMLNILRG